MISQFHCYWFQLVYLTLEHHPAGNLQHEILQTTIDMFDQSQHLLHTMQLFFFFCVCISYTFSFLELKQYVENVAFNSLFNIKMSTPKFTSFDKLFVCFFLFFNPWLIVKRRKKIIYMLPTRKNWHQSWGITHTVNEETESDITYKQKQENWDTNILIKKER